MLPTRLSFDLSKVCPSDKRFLAEGIEFLPTDVFRIHQGSVGSKMQDQEPCIRFKGSGMCPYHCLGMPMSVAASTSNDAAVVNSLFSQ